MYICKTKGQLGILLNQERNNFILRMICCVSRMWRAQIACLVKHRKLGSQSTIGKPSWEELQHNLIWEQWSE